MRKYLRIEGVEVGCVSFQIKNPNTLYIKNFIMYPEHRRKGYFKHLLSIALQEAKNCNCYTITLSVLSNEETPEFLFTLYERYGFKKLIGNHMELKL